MNISDSVATIKGVGPKTVALLGKLNIYTIKDLLLFYPRTYLRYDEPVPVREAQVGERVVIRANIQSYVDIKRVRSTYIM